MVGQEDLSKRYEQKCPQLPLGRVGLHVQASAAGNAGKAGTGLLQPLWSGGEPCPQGREGTSSSEPATNGVCDKNLAQGIMMIKRIYLFI